jgi:UDP-galactopyranose mutase
VVSKVGERLYETLYRGYTQKQWGRDPEDLSPHLAGRIPVRHDGETRYFDDPFQAVPAGGYTRLVEAMLDHENILLERGVDFFDARSSRQADLVVYTGELDRFFDYRWGKLEYRSMEPEFLTLDVECHQPAAVVNYPDDGVPWTRITEFKHFTGAKTPKTVICREYPKALGTPCYVVMTEENLRKRDLYMKEARRLEAAGRCLFTGRLAEYRYCNMDQAVAGALAKLRQHLQAR